MAFSAGYLFGDGDDHERDLIARGVSHSAFALVADATVAAVKAATEKHVAWGIDPADPSRYIFQNGFDLLLLEATGRMGEEAQG